MSDKQREINSFATEDPHLANCLEKAGLFMRLTLTAMGFAKGKKKGKLKCVFVILRPAAFYHVVYCH